jgi:short-subunit dehydrogenase
MEQMIALNITALTRLTYAAAPAFVGRGTGTIINIGSVLGISPETFNGVYGATKAYVLAFSHSTLSACRSNRIGNPNVELCASL